MSDRMWGGDEKSSPSFFPRDDQYFNNYNILNEPGRETGLIFLSFILKSPLCNFVLQDKTDV